MKKIISFFFFFFVFQLSFASFTHDLKGDIGFQIQISLEFDLEGIGCSKEGHFEKNYFFNTHGKKWITLDSQMGDLGYKLDWDNADQYLEHYLRSSQASIGEIHCNIEDDYEFCVLEFEQEIKHNCFANIIFSPRRLKYRYCPAGYFYKGAMARACEKCPDHYYSPDLNTDLECQYCPYPTKGDRCDKDCPPGTYVTTDQTCEDCPPGSFSNVTATKNCTKCRDVDSYWYQPRKGQTNCLLCPYISEDGINCIKPCPRDATGTRGKFGIHECRCGTVPSPSELYITAGFKDTNDLCYNAYYEGIIPKEGGKIRYTNGIVSYGFQATEKVYSVEFVGEEPHIRPYQKCQNQVQDLQDEILFLEEKIKQKEKDYDAFFDELIEKINKDERLPWKAKKNEIINQRERIIRNGINQEQLEQELSTIPFIEDQPWFNSTDNDQFQSNGNYDPRSLYPNCQWDVEDQDICGLCFIFSVATASSLRFCINSQEKYNFKFSAQHILNCGRYSCNGGYITNIFDYLTNYGAPNKECIKYISGRRGQSGYTCKDTCDDGSSKKRYFLKKGGTYRLKVSSAMKYLEEQGPIVSTFWVWEDFLAYDKGVFVHTWGEKLVLHAITIIGYGTEDGLDYWLCMNSWGKDFGSDNGVFKIQRGHFLIDDSLMMGTPDFGRSWQAEN